MKGRVALAVKKTPMRKCAGCDEMKDKKQLVRVVHTPEGEFMLDFTGKKSGRGVYVCKSRSCLEAAQKKRGLILVTGPTGSGKSTTLSAIIDYINNNLVIEYIKKVANNRSSVSLYFRINIILFSIKIVNILFKKL